MFEKILLFLQSEHVLFQAEMLLRIVIAGFCGFVIGYERTNRGKEAGIRTHTIVALASCLMMIISQYGFFDFFEEFANKGFDVRIDPSRVAAQIVSGIGFLGAGMIFIHKNVVTGLTTAAGIWAVAGIGMAIGSGMYFMGIICALIIVIVQFILHKNSKFVNNQVETEMLFVLLDSKENIDALVAEIEANNINILEISYTKKEEHLIEIKLLVHYDHDINKIKILNELYINENIQSAKI